MVPQPTRIAREGRQNAINEDVHLYLIRAKTSSRKKSKEKKNGERDRGVSKDFAVSVRGLSRWKEQLGKVVNWVGRKELSTKRICSFVRAQGNHSRGAKKRHGSLYKRTVPREPTVNEECSNLSGSSTYSTRIQSIRLRNT